MDGAKKGPRRRRSSSKLNQRGPSASSGLRKNNSSSQLRRGENNGSSQLNRLSSELRRRNNTPSQLQRQLEPSSHLLRQPQADRMAKLGVVDIDEESSSLGGESSRNDVVADMLLGDMDQDDLSQTVSQANSGDAALHSSTAQPTALKHLVVVGALGGKGERQTSAMRCMRAASR